MSCQRRRPCSAAVRLAAWMTDFAKTCARFKSVCIRNATCKRPNPPPVARAFAEYRLNQKAENSSGSRLLKGLIEVVDFG